MTTKRQGFIQVLAKLGKAHFDGRGGYVTRKAVNESAAGQSEISTKRNTEDIGFSIGRGNKPPVVGNPFYIPDLYTDVKKCSRCQKWRKPEMFSPQKRRGKVYLRSWCKHCEAEYKYQQYHGLLDGKSAP
jgi:hypothetical protein